MTPTSPDSAGSRPPRFRLQFRLRTILFSMVLMSLLAAVFGFYYQNRTDADIKGRFLLLSVLVPLGVVVVLGIVRFFMREKDDKPRW